MSSYPFVIASNRLPISVKKTESGLVFEPSSGGLATAMASLKEKRSIWVGWCGIADEQLTDEDRQAIRTEFLKHDCAPVFLTQQHVELYYDGYANDTLWPLFHYFQSVASHNPHYWQAYQEVNQLFADAITEISAADATIWIQDYHLMLLPELLKTQYPSSLIGFFLHIPFPSFEIFRLLPERTAILRGLLGADLIGFHIYDYSVHFLESAHRLLGVKNKNGELEYNGRTIQTGAYPIGIDYKKFVKTAESREISRQVKSLHSQNKKQSIILSIDRLDYSKGIPQRLEAFKLLLEEHPEYIGRVKLLMVAVPSRTDVATYQTLRDEIERDIARINGIFGTSDWAPISYQFQNRPFAEIVAMYRAADVMLVTPIRDGMNLVAKEFLASQTDDDGVLILSEMAGAIDELPEALSINPNSARSVADALHEALSMSKKKRVAAIKSMRQRIKKADIKAWSKHFIEDLRSMKPSTDERSDLPFSYGDETHMLGEISSAKRTLILLDYDGTLKPLVSSPSTLASFPSLRLLRILRRLSKAESVTLAIVSGRPKRALTLWLRGINVELAAEHGAWTRYGGQWSRHNIEFKQYKKKLLPILKRITAETKGSEIEVKDYAIVWHYRNVDPELAYAKSTKLRHELEQAIGKHDIGVYSGDKIIEVKPQLINKGRVVKELLRIHNPDCIVAIGDDYTDEDMFRALAPTDYTFKVGKGDTAARHRIESVSETIELLEKIVTTVSTNK